MPQKNFDLPQASDSLWELFFVVIGVKSDATAKESIAE